MRPILGSIMEKETNEKLLQMLSNKVDIALCTKVGPAVANKEICKGDVANPLQTNPLQMGAISLEKLFAQMPGVWLLWMVRIMPFSF